MCDDGYPCNGAEICDNQAGCIRILSSDCNGNAGEDNCDIANCLPDQLNCHDCNANGIPDECDITSGIAQDCQPNGIPDECELAAQTSRDCNADGIPDECAPITIPSAEPAAVAKCRALSLVPGNAGRRTGLRVTLVSLHHVDPPYTGGATVAFTSFEGQVRWVGPPRSFVESAASQIPFLAAELQCEPYYRDWGTIGLLHVVGSEVVPSSHYDVQAVLEDCSVAEEANFTSALRIATTRWGDVETPYHPPSATTQPDLGDVSALVDKFKGLAGAPIKARAALAGSVPDFGVDLGFDHISACIDAYKGRPYPNAPLACP